MIRTKRGSALLVVSFIAVALAACGGKVVVDSSSSPSTGGAGGSGGGGSTAVECPSVPPQDSEVMSLVGQPCSTANQICASNNGCGGCSVTCTNGTWTSTNASLCFSVGGTC